MKRKIINYLSNIIVTELSSAKTASSEAKSGARDSDIKPDSKWDTRAIEAGYLAGALEKRVLELERDLASLEGINTEPSIKVKIGSLVHVLEDNNEVSYFISPSRGGDKYQDIIIISYKSAKGAAILGLAINDEVEVELPNSTTCISILKIE